MNIFLKYGIKEVADVTFYSIVRVDKEEFYVPVLFLDTLKISSLNKSLENSVRYGGYGNSSTVSWNFEKGATIKLEDALFSQMSMNMFLNGQVSTSMSNWISAIAKLNVANTYGNKNYSTKTYPSPTLTPKEWDIIYRCAQKVGYFSDTPQGALLQFSTSTKASQYIYEEDKQDGDVNKYVAKNRWKLMDNYYKRTQPSILPVNIAPYIDFNRELSDSISLIHLNVDNKEWQLNQIKKMINIEDIKSIENIEDIKDVVKVETPILIKWHNKKDIESYSLQTSSQFNASGQNLVCTFKRNGNKWNCIEAYITLNRSTYNNIILNLRTQAFNASETTGGSSYSYIHYKSRYYIGNEFFLNNAAQFLFPLCSDDEIKNIGHNDFNKITYKAMPKEIIDEIMNEVTIQQKIGGFNNNLSFSDSIDRMEKCVVTDQHGLDIDLVQQSKNIQKKYTNVQENYSILYDAKTMLPFVSDDLACANDYSQKAIYIDNTMYNSKRTEKEKLRAAIKYYSQTCGVNVDYSNYVVTKIETPSDVDSSLDARLYYIKFNQPKVMHLRPGTVYYKWSRTIPTDNLNTYIGTDIDISTDYFSGEYMIVGETLIRNQMTGQDEHYQLVLNRTTVSQCANLQLQAGSNPVTFSMELNVLQPKVDKPMVQLKQFKTVEDKQYGGNKIIPQFKQHVQTFTEEIVEQEIEANNEIY